jgi:hypothetical protein
MEKEPPDQQQDQTSDPDPDSQGEGADEYAERQQTEEETRGHGPETDEG